MSETGGEKWGETGRQGVERERDVSNSRQAKRESPPTLEVIKAAEPTRPLCPQTPPLQARKGMSSRCASTPAMEAKERVDITSQRLGLI